MSRLGQYVASLKPVGLAAGAIMWVVWVISIALGSGNLDRNGQVIGADHAAFHTAAVLIHDGRSAELFEFPTVPALAERQEQITGKPGFFNPFRNPPIYGGLYVPTAYLPYSASYAIWATISLIMLAVGLACVCGRKFLIPMLWSLSFYPVFAVISFGQNSLLSIGVFGLVYLNLSRDRLFISGLSAALLCYKPQLLLGLGFWWLLGIRKYWPSLIGLLCASAIFVGLNYATMPEATTAFVRNFPELARYDAFDFYNLHNPRGFGALLTGDKSVGNWLGAVCFVLTLIWLARFWRRHGNDYSLMFSAAIFATLFGSPHTMIYEWSLIILAACVLWRVRPNQRTEWLMLFAFAWIVLFVSTPLTKWQVDSIGYAVQVSVPALALIALAAERVLDRWRTTANQCGT